MHYIFRSSVSNIHWFPLTCLPPLPPLLYLLFRPSNYSFVHCVCPSFFIECLWLPFLPLLSLLRSSTQYFFCTLCWYL